MSKLNKTLSLIVTTMAFVVTQGAIAQDAPKTRADVKAETKASKATGAMPVPTEVGAPPAMAASKSMTTRAEVKAETKQAKSEGKMAVPTETGSPASAPRKMPSEKSRAEVKGDLSKPLPMKDGKTGAAEK